MSPMMQRVLEAAKTRTRFSLTRGFRRWRWRRRFLPALAWRGGWSGGGLQDSMSDLVCYKIWLRRDIRRCARIRGRERYQRGGSECRWLVEIDNFPGQSLRTPARNSASLAAIRREKEEGEGGGGRGLFIGTVGARIGQALMRIEAGKGVTVSGNGHRHDLRSEVEDNLVLTSGARCQ
jgi:hypothetical protein